MEKRLLLFFALTFLIVSMWWRIFPPPEPVVEETAPLSEGVGTTEDVPVPSARPAPEGLEAPVEGEAEQSEEEAALPVHETRGAARE